MENRLLSFVSHGDKRGQLIAIEEGKDYPFTVKRVYYIYNTLPGVRRGFHAHKKLEQVLICVKGSCYLHLDNGFETSEICLNNPNQGLYLSNDIWREMYDFSSDAVLLVLASELYDENDYIRNYEDFLKYVRGK